MGNPPAPNDVASPDDTPGTAPQAPVAGATTARSGSNNGPSPVQKGLRFWLLVAVLAVASLLVALEVTIVSTGTATIVTELGGRSSYVWIPAAYLIALTSLQPFFGQGANIFGRRYPFIATICTFVLGSGICGGANNMPMLIAGRVVQGIGGAGVNALGELIFCDLVPLSERGSIVAIVFGASALGPAVGPVIGGALVERAIGFGAAPCFAAPPTWSRPYGVQHQPLLYGMS